MHPIDNAPTADAASEASTEGSLDGFVQEIHRDIEAFAAAYRVQHAANPVHFPLTLNADNRGLWFEFFMDHCMKEGA